MRDAIEMKLICDYIAIIIRIESLENFTRYGNKDRIDLSYDALNLPASDDEKAKVQFRVQTIPTNERNHSNGCDAGR